MKPIIFVLLSFLLFSFVANTHKNELEKAHIKGKVKTVTISDYSVDLKTGKADTLVQKEIDHYDKNGNLINSSLYSNKGKYMGGDTVQYVNEKHQVKEMEYDVKDGKVSQGRINIYKCDANWNKLKALSYTRDTILINMDTFKYDNNRHLIEEVTGYFQIPPDKGFGKECCEFTKSGYTKYVYDSVGNDIEEDNYPNMVFSGKEKYKYDEKGNCIEVSGFDPSGKPRAAYTTKYENFDKKGNWQKMTRVQNNVADVITLRQIEYYP